MRYRLAVRSRRSGGWARRAENSRKKRLLTLEGASGSAVRILARRARLREPDDEQYRADPREDHPEERPGRPTDIMKSTDGYGEERHVERERHDCQPLVQRGSEERDDLHEEEEIPEL